MPDLTLDTGALIALERANRRMVAVLRAAMEDRCRITVPAPVITEWWRADASRARNILLGLTVEPLTKRLAAVAGEAIAAVTGATAVDAIVMASAAQRGDVVFTSDVDDLMRLQRHFPSVRVLHV